MTDQDNLSMDQSEPKAASDYFGDDDLITNPAARVPFCVCADISGSMERTDPVSGKKPIEELNGFINGLMAYIREHPDLATSVELSLVTFESTVEVVRDFALCKAEDPEVQLTAKGGTALAHGVDKALEILNERKLSYKNTHVPYYQPVLVLITDGKPGDKEDLPDVALRTSQLAEESKLSIFPVVIGSDDNEEKWRSIASTLEPLSPKHKPLHLKGLAFSEFMNFLTQSIERLLTANPLDDKPVQTADPNAGGGWGEW